MKKAKYVALLIATFEISLLYASNLAQKKGPPKPHVKSAKIFVDQGDVIYGNSRMQSKLRVQYELFDDFELLDIELREFKTNKLIEGDYAVKNPNGRDVSGWFVSETDNGYDHNIVQESRETSPTIKELGSTYVYSYVSSTNRKSWINICFVLRSSAKNNDNLDDDNATFSTCDDDGIIDGSVTIFSEAPKQLRGTDFILKKYASLDENRADLYIINPSIGISRGMNFKALNPLNATLIVPSYRNAIIYRSYKTKVDEYSAQVDYEKTVFAIAYLLKNKKNNVFKYYSLDKNTVTSKTELIIDTSSVKSAAAVILNYKHNNNRAVYYTDLCNLEKRSAESEYVYCYKISLAYEPEKKQCLVRTLTIILDNLKKEAAVITLIDNYGTSHKITLSYGIGDENYDLFIN